MNDHAVGFIDDDEVIVLLEDGKRNVLGDEFGGCFFGNVNCDGVA